MKPLIAAGLDTLSIDGDLGAAWTEAARTFAARAREVRNRRPAESICARRRSPTCRGRYFRLNPLQAVATAAQIEAGTIELTLRDLGGVDIAVAQYARTQNVSRDAARQSVIDRHQRHAATDGRQQSRCGGGRGGAGALYRNPGTNADVKLTPRAKVPAMQLFQLLKTDPLIALAQFRIEASTGL